jgi:anti-sigma factor RsiW
LRSFRDSYDHFDPVAAQTVHRSGLRTFSADDRVTPPMSPSWHELRFRRDHRWTPPHMSAYLDSDLSAWPRARLERHTAECPECRGVLDDLRHMLALLHSAPAPEPVADGSAIATAVLRRLHESAEH